MAVADIISQIAAEESEDEQTPVFLTDLDKFDVFTEAKYVFEHIPSAKSRSLGPPNLDWDRYLTKRLDLLLTKWRPIAMVPFGKTAQDVLNAWRRERDIAISARKLKN